MDQSLHDIFIQEAEDNIVILENSLISMEENPEDQQNINEAFRAIHSIKGGAGLAGFSTIKDFTHVVEDLLECIRSESLKVSTDSITVLLESLDVVKMMIANISSEKEAESGLEFQDLIDRIKSFISGEEGESAAVSEEKSRTNNFYYISLKFDKDIFGTGIDPTMFIADLQSAGTILDIEIIEEDLPDEESFDPEKFYLGWKLFFKSEKSDKEILDIFCFVIDESEIVIENLDEALEKGKDITTWMVHGKSYSIYTDDDLVVPDRRGKSSEKFGRRASDRVELDAGSSSFIRVKTDKLENIFNTVSELLIAQASLNMLTEQYEEELDDSFSAVSDSLKNITTLLQEQITALRMMSLSGTFDRFKRVVRDIAQDRGKKVRFIVQGQDTELDKNMIEKLNDPLKHLVRNCIDHGIEVEEERIRLGKDPEGELKIAAFIENGKVVIQISDDGAGINREKIMKKAEERGLISDGMTDGDILNLIFHPGLSTAEKVTDLSGRGVGMDVVKNSIIDLHGNIEVSSKEGEGTVFTLHLPLTLAILDGMLVRVGEEKYILPTLSILEIFRPTSEDLKSISGRGEVVFFRGDYIPLLRISNVLRVSQALEEPEKGELIVVYSGGTKAALLVDSVLEQFQIVLKSLQKNFRKVDYISSATILGNGDVALILDVQSILQQGMAKIHVPEI